MIMKVIVKGTPKKDRVWEGKCRDCESVVEAYMHELKIIHDPCYGTTASAKCPVCQNKIYFNEVK